MPLKYYDEFILSSKDDDQIRCIDFSPDARFVAYGSGNRLTIVSLNDGQIECKIIGTSTITALLWLFEEKDTLVCTYNAGIIANFTIHPDDYVDAWLSFTPGHNITHLAVDKQKPRLATGAGEDIRIWNAYKEGWKQNRKLLGPRTTGDNSGAEVLITGIHWSRYVGYKDEVLIVSYKSHGVQVWDVEKGCVITTLLTTASAMGQTSLSPDNLHLAVAMRDCFDVYNTQTRIPVVSLRPTSGLNAPISFIHGGKAVLGTTKEASARLWDSSSGIKLATLLHDKHSDQSQIVALASADCPQDDLFWIATASPDRVVIWKAQEVNAESKRRERHGTGSHLWWHLISQIPVVIFVGALVTVAILQKWKTG